MAGGQALPLRRGRAVRRLGQRAGLGCVAEDVTGRRQLGQHHDPRALGGRLPDRIGRGRAILLNLADTQADLACSDPGRLGLDTRKHYASLGTVARYYVALWHRCLGGSSRFSLSAIFALSGISTSASGSASRTRDPSTRISSPLATARLSSASNGTRVSRQRVLIG